MSPHPRLTILEEKRWEQISRKQEQNMVREKVKNHKKLPILSQSKA